MNRVRFFRLLLIALALGAFFKGGYIHVKAELAQTLLQAAWSRGIATGQAQKPWPWADTRAVARIVVPGKGIDLVVLDGGSGEAMAFGPALFADKSQTENGPLLLGGHRDTHLGFLADLTPGQELVYSTVDGKTLIYRLESTLIADSRSERLGINPGEDALILVTCYPFDALLAGGPLRYVAIALPVKDTDVNTPKPISRAG